MFPRENNFFFNYLDSRTSSGSCGRSDTIKKNREKALTQTATIEIIEDKDPLLVKSSVFDQLKQALIESDELNALEHYSETRTAPITFFGLREVEDKREHFRTFIQGIKDAKDLDELKTHLYNSPDLDTLKQCQSLFKSQKYLGYRFSCLSDYGYQSTAERLIDDVQKQYEDLAESDLAEVKARSSSCVSCNSS